MGNSATDIAVNATLLLAWLWVAVYGGVWFAVRAYHKSKDRVLSEWNNEQGDE